MAYSPQHSRSGIRGRPEEPAPALSLSWEGPTRCPSWCRHSRGPTASCTSLHTHTVPDQHPPWLCFLPPVACRSSWGRGVQWEGPTFLQYLSYQILPALDIHHVIQSPLHSYEVDSISILWMRKLKLRRIKEFAPSHTDCEKRSWSWHQSVFHSKTYVRSTEAPFLLPEG